MNDRAPSAVPGRRRSAGRRDLLLIALVAVAVFLLGMLAGVFGGHRELLDAQVSAIDEVLGALVLITLGLAAFAALRWRQAHREEALRTGTERRFQALVEQVPAVAYTWDGADDPGTAPAAYISPQIEHLLGYTAQQWLQDPELWGAAVHPDDLPRVLHAWDEAVRSGAPFCTEYRIFAASGRLVWVRDEAVPVSMGARGRAIYQGVLIDISEEQVVQNELRLAEEKYRSLVENMPAITYVSDVQDPENSERLRYVAPAIERLSGYTPAEWVSEPGFWERAIHPEDHERIVARTRETRRTREPFDVEYRLVRKDGGIVWVHDSAVVVPGGVDGADVWQGVVQDVSRHKAAEQQLRRAEDRFRTLVEQLPAITYIEDAATKRTLYISPQVESMFGYTPGEWIADPHLWEQRVHPDDRDRVVTGDDAHTGDVWSADYRTIARDGHVVWVHNEAVLIRDERGHPLGWQGVIFDVTDGKKSEHHVRQAEERYRSLVEQLPVMVYMDAADDLATALYISPQYERLTGYTAEQRMADPGLWVRMLHPDDRERVLVESNRTNETGDPFDVEYRIVRADGRVVWVRDHAFLVEGPGGHSAWQGVLTDITDRRMAQEALTSRDRILDAACNAAERFLTARAWTECIGDVLERLGRAGGATRAYVYENQRADDADLIVRLRHAWIDPERRGTDVRHLEPGSSYLAGGFGRWEEVLRAGGVIHGPVRDYPESERLVLHTSSILSCIAVPVFVEEEWWGYVGFDHCAEEREWQPAEIDAVRVIANTLGAAIGRERALQRLSETQARYRTLVEQIPAITYVERAGDREAVYTSPQVRSLLGYTEEEWSSHGRWLAALHPDDRDRVVAENDRTDDTGEPFALEYRLFAKDGRVAWVRDEAVLLRNEQGAPLYWQGVMFDITGQKEAEEQLREAEARFRTLVEQMPAITYVDERSDDPDAVVWSTVYISPQVERILGYSVAEWQEDPDLWLRMVHPEDKERAQEADALHYRDAVPLDIEIRVITKQGEIRWIRDQAQIIRNEHGEARYSQGILVDMTERRLAEEQLRDAEERYRAIVEHVPSAIYLDMADQTMQTVYISPRIEEITGITPEEWTHDPDAWVRSVHPDDRDEVVSGYLAAIAGGRSWSAEYRVHTRDGRTIWVHDETTLLHDEQGNPTYLQGVISDITERRLAEQALRDSEQREREAAERLRALDEMKNTFLAAVSHELRSPLTSILGLSLTLERAREMNEEDRGDLLDRLAANARKLDRLLKDLLDIDRLNRGIVEPQYRVTDVGALARRTADSIEALADRDVVTDTEAVVLRVDAAKVERIVENLLMNAARHTTTDRRIWLRVRASEGGASIDVEDDGPGVPAELREAIFEPFRQGPTASPHSPGTGIGLSLVARFAELHGGRAWVEERDGGGASFRVYIPAGPGTGLGRELPAPELAEMDSAEAG